MAYLIKHLDPMMWRMPKLSWKRRPYPLVSAGVTARLLKLPLLRSLILLLIALLGWQVVSAQEASRLIITRTSAAEFPLIRLNLVATDAQGNLLTDLSGLSLRENGIPVGDLEFSEVTVGVNVIFVVDANSSSVEVDDQTGLTRLEKIGQSINRYANEFMAEPDQVSIVVPDFAQGSGRFLVEEATTPAEVISAVEAYAPPVVGVTPLNEMMLLALAHAADGRNDGRFQAILLFSDGASIGRQLAFSTLVAQAQTVEVPIYTAIVGARADPGEIDNVALLYEPTYATYVHMPDATGTDSIYEAWKRHRTQTEISYHSRQSSSGRFPVSVNIGTTRSVAELTIAIAPPEVTLATGPVTIHRVGTVADAPSTALDPTEFALRVRVDWPDGLPRDLVAGNFFVDGQLQQAPASLDLEADGALVFDWNIAALEEGSYELIVQVTDELGLTAVSDPVFMAIETERPSPPTPTPIPTIAPVEIEPVPESVPVESSMVALLAAVGLVALLLLVRVRRQRQAPDLAAAQDDMDVESEEARISSEPVELIPHIAFLEVLDAAVGHVSRIRIEAESVTIGRDPLAAQIVFDDPSVSRLHARIRKRDAGYWLYDEGSAEGTYHNFERLGLTPRPLADQDVIRFGRVGLRFHIQQIGEDE